jgi:hypothetical protein
MARTILGNKKGEAKERPKDAEFERPKKKERISLFCGKKLSHPWTLLCHQHVNLEI